MSDPAKNFYTVQASLRTYAKRMQEITKEFRESLFGAHRRLAKDITVPGVPFDPLLAYAMEVMEFNRDIMMRDAHSILHCSLRAETAKLEFFDFPQAKEAQRREKLTDVGKLYNAGLGEHELMKPIEVADWTSVEGIKIARDKLGLPPLEEEEK